MESTLNDREIVLPADALSALHDAIRKNAGGGAAQRILRELGHTTGVRAAAGIGTGGDAFGELLGPVFWNRLALYLSRRGWGTVRHAAAHPGIGLLETADWVDDGTGSPFSEGMLAGLLSTVAGVDVGVARVPRPDGGAIFAFGAPDTVMALRLHLARGLDLDGALESL